MFLGFKMLSDRAIVFLDFYKIIISITIFLTIIIQNGASILKENEQIHDLVKRAKDKRADKILPSLSNCVKKEIAIRSSKYRPFLMENEFIYYPSMLHKDNSYNYRLKFYDYFYKSIVLIERNGESVKIPLDVSKYIKHKTWIVFPAYSLKPGLYRTTCYIKLKKNIKLEQKDIELANYNLLKRFCYLKMMAVPPFVTIKGGSYKMVPSDKEITLDGRESLNKNKKISSNEDLKYEWKCKQETQPPLFCNKDPISTNSMFTIPSKFVTEGEKFEIILNVTTPEYTSANYTQVVEVKVNAVQLRITCEKNCPPLTDTPNFRHATFFKVKCVENCGGLKEDDYEWTISKKNGPPLAFDYKKNTQFGRNGAKFVIEKNVLQPGNYTIEVKYKGIGEAEMDIEYRAPPKISCSIAPTEGKALATKFKLKCEEENTREKNHYELLIRDTKDPTKEESVINHSFPEINDVTFRLPPSDGKKFIVRVSSSSGPSTEIPVNALVTSSFKDNKSPKENIDAMKSIYDGEDTKTGKKDPGQSIPGLLHTNKSEDRQTAMSTFKTLVDDLVNIKDEDKELKDFINNLKYKATEDILKTPLESTNDILQVGDSITKLMAYKEAPKSDPLLSKLSTTICKKMMDKYMEAIKKEKFPLNHAQKSLKISKTLSKCLEVNTNPNFEVLQPIDQNIIITEAPWPDVPIIKEDYENYVDYSEEYYEYLDNLKEATYNIINASATSTKVVAMSMAIGEKPVENIGEKTASIVAKDTGDALAKSKITSQRVTVIPSRDWLQNDHPFDVLISTWGTDIMWWNTKKTKVSTDIASIQFWHSTCKERVDKFDQPVNIFFTISENSSFKASIFEDTLTVPENYLSLPDEDLNHHIKVQRITVPKGLTLYTEFYNLSETDAFDVVTTSFQFPTMKHFSTKNITIGSKSETSLRFINHENNNVWWYIGILPNKLELGNNIKSLKYRISFTAKCCIRWNESNSNWERACQPGKGSNISIISCQCHSFSVFAGYEQNAKSIHQKILTVDIELELQKTFIIFITTSLTLLLFCILSVFIVWKKQDPIFYLADNHRRHLYAYLLIVTTGNKRNSGTTSNVTIKLVGKKNSSDSHVLNYPDPKLRLLQKYGEDFLILTTEHHLGDLKQIELWNDCRGPSPDWICKSIVIYDMQEETEWRFEVGKKLSVIKGESHITLEPAADTNNKIWSRFTFNRKYHTWWIFDNERNFSYWKKLIVILSTVLTTFAIALICLGLPNLRMSDCLDAPQYRIDGFTVLLVFASSLPSFLIHSVIVWCFRSRKKERICWSLLIALIVLSLALLIIFGFWVPPKKSWIWLTVCMIGFSLDIFFYEIIFVFLHGFFHKNELMAKIKDNLNYIIQVTEEQRRFLYKRFGDLLLRPYFKHLYKRLTKQQIKEKRMTIQRRREIISELEDLVMFGVYVFILYIVILANKDRFIVKSKIEMEEVMSGLHTRTLDFKDISSFNLMYEYINKTLIPTIQPLKWYGDFVISDPGQMVDNVNKYIGVARFRQQRMMPNVCAIAEVMQFVNKSNCWPEFSLVYTETRSFGYGWGAFSPHLFLDRLKSIWEYSDQDKTGTLPTIGEFSTYSGGGYVAYLGRTLYNSYANFRKLAEKFWIDQKTRSVFIEFLTYNTNYNVFNSVKMSFELSATGDTSSYLEVHAVRMLFVNYEMQKISVTFLALFIIWVVMLFLKQSLGAVKKIRTFYKDVWFLIDFVIIIMSVVCIAMFAIRTKMVGTYFDILKQKKHNEFLSYFYLFYIEDFLTIFAAILVCIATVRLWKFLRFGLMFRMFERTLSLAAVPLSSALLAFACLLIGFSSTIVFLYGNEYEKIHTVAKTARLLVTIALRPAELEMKNYTKFSSAYFYFSVYVVVIIVTIYIFIIIICMAYANAQLEFSDKEEVYNIKHYVLEMIEYIPRFIRYKYFRMRGGQSFEEINPQSYSEDMVRPKSDKFLYSSSFSVLTSRMKTMQYVTRCIIRNMRQSVVKTNYFVKSDIEEMLEVCRHFLEKPKHNEEVEFFFKGRVKGKKIGLIDEQRIIKVARAANAILQQKSEASVILKRSSKSFDQCVQAIHEKQTTLKICDLVLKLLVFKLQSAELKWMKQLK